MLDETNRNAKLGNARNEFAGAVERIDHPNIRALQTDGIVHALFGKPALAIAQKFLAQNRVQGAVCFGYWIASDFVFRLNRSRREASKNRARGFQCGLNAFQYLRVEF